MYRQLNKSTRAVFCVVGILRFVEGELRVDVIVLVIVATIRHVVLVLAHERSASTRTLHARRALTRAISRDSRTLTIGVSRF